MRPWVAFFSQTGSEICNLTRRLKRAPDLIVTNRTLEYVDTKANPELQPLKSRIRCIPKAPASDDYLSALREFSNPLVTLHGYLRIVPPDICNAYEIYNLHPGLITKYPELKGKDPQKRAFEAWHPYAGCVIHRCEPELDSGKIVADDCVYIHGNKTVESVITDLHALAGNMWYQFLKDQFALDQHATNK